MKILLFVLLINCHVLLAQSKGKITYTGVVVRYNSESTVFEKEIATCNVVKTVKADTVTFSYVLLHDKDTTMYELKFSNDRCCKIVHHWGMNWIVSDSLKSKDEHIYVYDIYEPDIDEIDSYFCVSPTFGIVSIGSFTRAEYFHFDGYPHFETLIEPYRKQWSINH